MRDNKSKDFSIKSIPKRLIAVLMAVAMTLGMVYVNNRNDRVLAGETERRVVDNVDGTDTTYISNVVNPVEGQDYTIHVPVTGIVFSLPEPTNEDTIVEKTLYPGDDGAGNTTYSIHENGEEPIVANVSVTILKHWEDGSGHGIPSVAVGSKAYYYEIKNYTYEGQPIEGLDDERNQLSSIDVVNTPVTELDIAKDDAALTLTASGDNVYTQGNIGTDFYYGITEFYSEFDASAEIPVKDQEVNISGSSWNSLSDLNAELNTSGNSADGYYNAYQIIMIPYGPTEVYYKGMSTDRDFYIDMAEDITATADGTTGTSFTGLDPTKDITITFKGNEDISYNVSHTGDGPDPDTSAGLVPGGTEETITISTGSAPKDYAGKSDTYTVTVSDASGDKTPIIKTISVTYDEGKPTVNSLTINGNSVAIDGTGTTYANAKSDKLDLVAVVGITSGSKAKLKKGTLNAGETNEKALTVDATAGTLTGELTATGETADLSEGENDFSLTAESTYDIPLDSPVTFKVIKDTTIPVIRQSKLTVTQDSTTIGYDDLSTKKISALKDAEVKVVIDDGDATTPYKSEVDPASVTVSGISTITGPDADNVYSFTIPADSDNAGKTIEYKINAKDNAGNDAKERTIAISFYNEEADIEFSLNENQNEDGFVIWSSDTHQLEFNYTVTSEVELQEANITYSVNGQADATYPVALGTPEEKDGKYVYTMKDANLPVTSSIELNKATFTVKNNNDYTSTKVVEHIKIDVSKPTDVTLTPDKTGWQTAIILTITASDDTDGSGVYSGVERFFVSTSNCMNPEDNKSWPNLEGSTVTFAVPESADASGTKVIAKALDKARNPVSDPVEGTFYVDKTKPVSELKIGGKSYDLVDGTYINTDPQITFTASDVPSGFKTDGVEFSVSPSTKTMPMKSDTAADNEANKKSLSYLVGTDAMSGAYTVTYTVTDKANQKVTKTATFTVDKEAPDIKINKVQSPTKGKPGYYNTNVDVEITVTDDNIPKADGYLKVTENGEPLNVDWTKTSSGWKAKVSFPEEGVHDLKVTAKDKANNKNSAKDKFTIDRTDPVINTTLNGSEYSGKEKYIKGTGVVGVTVTDDTEDISDISVTIEHTDPATGAKDTEIKSLAKSKKSDPYPNVDCKENGHYEIEYTVIDLCGNASVKTIAFTVDNQAPKNNMYVTAAKPAKFSKYQNAYSNKVGKFGDAKEAYSYGQYYASNVGIDLQVFDYNIDSITVTDNGSALSPSWSYSNGINSASITISSEGYHEIKIRSVDKSGNVTDDSGSTQKIIFVIDKTAPVISLALNGAGYSDGSGVRYLTSDGYVDISVSDTNKDTDDLTRVTMTTPPGSGQSSSTEYVGEGQHSFTTEADYEIHYIAIDKAGNRSAERVMTFRVDKTAPQLNISSTAGGGTATSAVTVTFTMNEAFYADVRSGEIKVYKKIDGQGESLLETIEFKPKSASDSLSKTYADDGEYRFEFTAQDMAGNTATPAQHTFILDGTAPIITLSGVKNYDITDKDVKLGVTVDEAFYSTNNVVLKGTREDIDGKVENLKFDDVSFNRGKLTNFEKEFKEDGIYDIDISSTDKAGNKDEKSVHFTIDTKAPEIGDLSKYDGTILNEFKFDLDLDALVKDLTVCDITVYLDGVEYDGMSDIEDGSHVLKIVATDEMNHTTTKEVTFLLDTKGPNIIVSGIEEGQKVVDPTDISVSVQLDEDTLDTVQLNGQAVDLADNEASLTVNKKGSYTLTATAHDEAGNKSSVELHFNYGSKINWLLIGIIGGGVLLIALLLLLLLRRRKEN